MGLQPTRRSFENYLRLGYEYSSGKRLKNNELKILKKVQEIDEAVLIIDDILDSSKLRNGNPCLYLRKGIPQAIVQAELHKLNSIESIAKLMNLLKTQEHYKRQVQERLNEFFKSVYSGEELNLGMTGSKKSTNLLTKEYFKMVKLFTGGHIRYSLEIGQLIANNIPEKTLSKVAEHAGVIRQIVDDFNDYYNEHHEPFGDFINNENRLPEILFTKFKGCRGVVVKRIKKKRFAEARVLVLNKNVRDGLYQICKREHGKIKNIKIKFDKSSLVEDYMKILSK